jgi:hypothetical protein
MKKKTLAILNAVFLAITLVMNYLSNTGYFNGNTMKTVSDRYHNLFTPAPYAFSIWGLIYLFLLVFIIYSFIILKREKESHIISEISIWFIITCIANSLWVVAWLYDHIGISVLLMLILLLALVKIILNTKAELTNPPFRIVACVWWPYTIYAGWISVALIADIAAFLTKIQWSGFGFSESAWAIIMIVIAGMLYLFITWKRNMREYALVGTWALIAVAIANKENHHDIYLAALLTAIIIAVSSMAHAFKNFRGFGKTFEDYETITA